jgi:hypothetical protein
MTLKRKIEPTLQQEVVLKLYVLSLPVVPTELPEDLCVGEVRLPLQVKTSEETTTTNDTSSVVSVSPETYPYVLSGWYPLTTPRPPPVGQLFLAATFESIIILPDASYIPLLKCLLKNEMTLTLRVLRALGPKTSQGVTWFVQGFETQLSALHLLKTLLKEEITHNTDPRVLFRANTIATKAMDVYMRLRGLSYLHRTLAPILHDICQSKSSCEVRTTDSSRNHILIPQSNRVTLTFTLSHILCLNESNILYSFSKLKTDSLVFMTN